MTLLAKVESLVKPRFHELVEAVKDARITSGSVKVAHDLMTELLDAWTKVNGGVPKPEVPGAAPGPISAPTNQGIPNPSEPAKPPLVPVITFPVADHHLGDPPFTVAATSSAPLGLPIVYSVVSGPATISGQVVTLKDVGTVVLRATQGTEHQDATFQVLAKAA